MGSLESFPTPVAPTLPELPVRLDDLDDLCDNAPPPPLALPVLVPPGDVFCE